MRSIVTVVLLFLLPVAGFTQEAQDALFLETQGYPASEYALLLTWAERGLAGAETWVTGYHLAPRDGSAVLDVYARDGRMLSREELDALGVRAKNWNLQPREAASEPTTGPKAAKEILVPWGALQRRGAGETILLDAPDIAAARAEDAAAASGEKGVQRIGLFRELNPRATVAAGQAVSGFWDEADDGSVCWSVTIHSPGAVGIRLEFERLSLPSEAWVLVYNAFEPEEAYGPFDSLPPDGTTLWTPTCFSDTVVLECSAPSMAETAAVDLSVARIAHIYRGFDELAWEKTQADSCNLDASCYPEYAQTALGVGGLGSIGFDGVVWCTGSLIVDLDPCTDRPFLLTANHCIPDTQRANSLEVYWLYQTAECNGTAPSPLDVPRTIGGANRIAYLGGRGDTGGGNDFCLLRLRQEPVAGLTQLGWRTQAPPLGESVTCIHHPRGDYKRISFGNLTNTDNPHARWFHEVTWSEGTTQPGSSGSPLLHSATQQIIGQLWGGEASCTKPLEPDYYGRFDVTYSIIEAYLSTATTVGFSQAEYSVEEGAGTCVVKVDLSAPAGAGGASVAYTLQAGTAVSNRDFAPGSGVVDFAPNAEEASFEVGIVDDTHFEPEETFTITLSEPVCAIINPGYKSVTVRIQDDDTDTDGDGLSDVDELSGTYGFVTDPNAKDMDHDGLSDSQEVFRPFGYVTNPGNADTDGDGINDYTEIILGLDPVDPSDSEEVSSLRIPWFGAL